MKLIAAGGGLGAPVALSSRELGQALGVSQQAASTYLLALARAGLLQRTFAGRRQGLRLTSDGAATLRRELS